MFSYQTNYISVRNLCQALSLLIESSITYLFYHGFFSTEILCVSNITAYIRVYGAAIVAY